MTKSEVKSFWELVSICLREFWEIDEKVCQLQIAGFREHMDRLQIENAVYHEEPYYIARDIVGKDANFSIDWPRYIEFRQQVLNTVPRIKKRSSKASSPKGIKLVGFSDGLKVKESEEVTNPRRIKSKKRTP